ncbi:MAG: replication endonuclease [Plesiomonas shigelloides]
MSVCDVGNEQGPWAYWWNAPRQPAENHYATYDELIEKEQVLAKQAAFQGQLALAQELLQQQTALVRIHVMHILNNLEQEQGAERADTFLAKNFPERILPRVRMVSERYQIPKMTAENARFFQRFNRLPDMSASDVELLADDIANQIFIEVGLLTDEFAEAKGDLALLHILFSRANEIAAEFMTEAPLYNKLTTKCFNEDDALASLYRMMSNRWWRTHLRRHSRHWREHLQIALTNVSKQKSTYVSKSALSDWKEQKRRTREFLKSMELIDEDENRISLIDKYWGSVANPAIRRTELMVRIRGFEDICESMGYVGKFYTITAPSKYHATTIHGHRNRKWNGSSPSDTQHYLCGVWKCVRSKLNRKGLRVFGLRVAEPHHDGTPHWHMLLFMRPEDTAVVDSILDDYVTAEDRHELSTPKAMKARFLVKDIDPEMGSATGYVAKYVSKNIDGYALDDELDDESNLPMKQAAAAAAAWSGRWNIRQFQFVGGAPVTVYRELRRMRDHDTALGLSVEFAEVHDAADNGKWADYINAQGGPFVRRADLVARTWYETSEEVNAYGEEIIRIKGVFASEVGKGTPILTRVKQWKIVPALAADKAAAVSGASASPRSSVNNCTDEGRKVIDNCFSSSSLSTEKLIAELKSRGFGMLPARYGERIREFDSEVLQDTAKLLQQGCRFNAGGGMVLYLSRGRVVESEVWT